MAELRVLIPAAGRGSRAGLPYPKTLYPVHGTPILHRLLATLMPYDSSPTVVVSPHGEPLIRTSLKQAALNAHLVVQAAPRGMGDAVLCFEQSPAAGHAEHILLAWGDLANLQPHTVASLVCTHFAADNDFTFVTRVVDQAYTSVQRDEACKVVSVRETREQDVSECQPGERDIGLFVFRKHPVFSMLRADLPGRVGSTTGEHGFLYVVQYLVQQGFRVVAMPIATEPDLLSLNSLSDLV
jgi:bifunctional N-acetylglucosamine-1-phosphate-uridyltransferase/glucosamine-1-phosphate-acetyltransferase GlmU-like protein